MNAETLVAALEKSREYFERSTRTLTEEDSGFAPAEGMMTVAHTVAHCAHSLDWFVEGAFESDDGFSMDFEGLDARSRAVTSLEAARAEFKRCYDRACAVISEQSVESLAQHLPEGPIMGGLPRFVIVPGIEDHTAHHRGALTVYARMLGKTPPMPYMEM